jgi:hypothetical protein
MDSQKAFAKKLPGLLVGIGLILLVIWLVLSQFTGHFTGPISIKISDKVSDEVPGHLAKKEVFHAAPILGRWSISALLETYGQAWLRIQAKVDELRHSDEDNARLRLESAHLRLELESTQFGCHSEAAAKTTQDLEHKLDQQTGSRIGQILKGMTYKPPMKLIPAQMYTLGLSYLKAHEDEKVAVIFSYLTALEETAVFKTPKNFLITGIAWYRMQNYILADFYFDEVLKRPEDSDNIQFQAQARLWKALVSKRTHKEIKTQYWMRELVEHHPHSLEAKWVN